MIFQELDRAANGHFSTEDYTTFFSCTKATLSNADIEKFSAAIHFYLTNDLVDARNDEML